MKLYQKWLIRGIGEMHKYFLLNAVSLAYLQNNPGFLSEDVTDTSDNIDLVIQNLNKFFLKPRSF